MLKSPVTLVLLFAMPIIFSLIFGSLQSEGEQEKLEIMVVEADHSYSDDLVTLLKQNDTYDWQETSLETAKEQVENDEVVAAVVIPQDVEKRLTEKEALFDVIVNQKTEEYLALSPYLEGTSRSVHQIYHDINDVDHEQFDVLLHEVASNEIIDVTKSSLEDGTEEQVNVLPVGFTIMFMMFALSNAASSIHQEREEKTWQRLIMSPVSSFQLITGYVLSYFILGWLQLGTLMLVMKLVFGVNWGDPLYFIPFASLTILLVVGFSLMMASLLKSKKQTQIVNAIVIVSTCMLGGIYWPLEIVPVFMQQISKFVPQTWMISGFEAIMQGDIVYSNFNMDVFVLSCFTIVFLWIGLLNLRKTANEG